MLLTNTEKGENAGIAMSEDHDESRLRIIEHGTNREILRFCYSIYGLLHAS